jgi:hypothetical protein
MSPKKLLIIFGSVIAVLALITGGLVFLGNQNSVPDANNSIVTPTPKPTNIDPNVVIPDGLETPPANLDPEKPSDITADQELQGAQVMFPDVHGTSKQTKEEVQLALYSAYNYTNAVLTDSYFLSGDFAKEGYSKEYFDLMYKDRFTNNAYASVVEAFQKIASGDSTAKTEGIRRLQQVADIELVDGTGYAVSTTCSEQQTGCVVDDYPTYSDISYDTEANDNGRLIVKFTTISKPAYINSTTGEQANMVNTYNWTLYMVPREGETNLNAGDNNWVIDGFDVGADKKGITTN